MSSVLDKVNRPEDLRDLSDDELDGLADEIRDLIIGTVSKTGGHLAANLGVVELTMALLRVFSPPRDKLVWDVSHQGYAYKILTGRKDRFHTLRQSDGISGFLKRDESEYDAFGAGHSGTAISAALGMAAARDRRDTRDEHVVAVLGDGSLGCGISLEALNNVAATTRRLIVILNDNEMSIAANVGSTARYLGKLLANPRYNRWKTSVEGAAKRLKLGWLRRTYYRMEETVKAWFLRSVLFEEFGLRYIGPIDGHDMHSLVDALTIARNYPKPIVVHVSTRKGKGYPAAESHPEKWHGTSSFDVETGESLSPPSLPTYSQVFGTTLQKLAADDERIVAITAAMRAGTGLSDFADQFPDRFFDVGICEEHAAVFAAGLAAEGLRPFFAVYSTFSQRAVDCVVHDICLQRLPVVLCLDRAGVVGDDGPTHHGVFDIPMLRPIPGLVCVQPKDEAQLANLLSSAITWDMPVAIRYPRGAGRGTALPDQFTQIDLGKAEVISPAEGAGVWLWALGDMIPLAEEVRDMLAETGVAAGIVNPLFIRPLDSTLLREQCKKARLLVTLENGVLAGGFGSAVEEAVGSNGCRCQIMKFGWPDQFIPHGKPDDLMQRFGLTARQIAEQVSSALARPA